MTEQKSNESWVYVFVCEPGKNESFLGLKDEEKDLNLLPVFQTKEEAQDCFLELPREKGKKYELQAVHVEDVQELAQKGGFTVAVLDGSGRIVRE